jgi:hypothetical protein
VADLGQVRERHHVHHAQAVQGRVPVGSFPATGKQWSLPMSEMWHFDAAGSVVGGEIYYDQVSLLAQLGLLPAPLRQAVPRRRRAGEGARVACANWFRWRMR